MRASTSASWRPYPNPNESKTKLKLASTAETDIRRGHGGGRLLARRWRKCDLLQERKRHGQDRCFASIRLAIDATNTGSSVAGVDGTDDDVQVDHRA
jgi:hypothetical protein